MAKTIPNVGLPVKFEGFQGADCRDVYTFFDDFLSLAKSAANDVGTWDILATVGAQTVADATDARQDLCGGMLELLVEATTGDQCVLAANGRSFQIDEGYPLYFEARIMNVDVSAVSWWIGLTGAPDTTPSAGLIGGGIGFENVSTAINTVCDDASATEKVVATSITAADGAWYRVAFYYDGVDTVTFYIATNNGEFVQVDQRKISTAADLVPDDVTLTPTIEAIAATSADGADDKVYVDYILVQQQRCFAAE